MFLRGLRRNHEYICNINILRFPSGILGFHKDTCSLHISWHKCTQVFPVVLRGLYVKRQYLHNLKCLRYPSNVPGFCIDIIPLECDHPCFTMYFQRVATRFLSNEVLLAFIFKPMFPQVCPRFSHGMDIEKKMYRCFPSLKTWENIMWNFSLRLFAESQVFRLTSI